MPNYNTANGTVGDKTLGVSESDPFIWIDIINIVLNSIKQKPNLFSKIKVKSEDTFSIKRNFFNN